MAALFALLFGDRIRPRVAVTVAPALYLESDGAIPGAGRETAGRMVAQASGWIEPDPYPVRVPFKTDGFVEHVHVLEGQSVRQGELIATLDASNHALNVAMLEAELNMVEAEQRAAEAKLEEATDRVARLQRLGDDDVSPVERIAADRMAAQARAMAEQQKARGAAIRTQLDQARLDLERTRVYAPADGVVLARHAAPGMKRMAGMDDMDSASAVTLYDPLRLQVRVEVPLSDAGRIETGMTARIVTAAFPNRIFTGVVSRITGEADITRNTLQMKVAILNPDLRMRPEMLCRVEFIGTAARTAAAVGTRQVWIPAIALLENDGDRAVVWVIDPVNDTAERRAVILGAEERNGYRPVIEGVRPGEKVVVAGADRLRPGALVTLKEGEQP
ncbi:MAG TPA: efflux RND transporter periplasmic adaptor subunit [Kiritimatiellia bacterium]|nr:efflux RND transporter periplasmic adaptor subunit [Kiritimatiellia bacterium]HMO99047.1 efflux RND transporter periplasmic adaptor subunit [Kiritimatiellia bacterium]HMP96123.1 efflux RND transporter periplasmic adaptor subunit [Kiritimatiellia bacterium]